MPLNQPQKQTRSNTTQYRPSPWTTCYSPNTPKHQIPTPRHIWRIIWSRIPETCWILSLKPHFVIIEKGWRSPCLSLFILVHEKRRPFLGNRPSDKCNYRLLCWTPTPRLRRHEDVASQLRAIPGTPEVPGGSSSLSGWNGHLDIRRRTVLWRNKQRCK